ncbi:MAG TPA: YeeE/YedE family protein [Puia sp.]|nr:YeeE/YedE family protein [Puia sp.]
MLMIEWLHAPWPWYVAGPLIGLTVPLLLVMGNKNFGVSSTLRQVCAACLPAKVPFFQYDWKKDAWNLYFVAGILAGGWVAGHLLTSGAPVQVSPALVAEMKGYGVLHDGKLIPGDLFNWGALLTVKGWLMMVMGGFLVGFGTRYAGGCTSGHSIMGLSNLQWPSLVATLCFMAGGFFMANVLLPVILQYC